ncbi:MAG: hypothetical protein ACRENL_10760 [Candidatus Dormibacteria bacterium]
MLRALSVPHCADGAHEAWSEDFDDQRRPQQPRSLGMQPCEHKGASYLPGQTVHLTAAQAAVAIAGGAVAAPGSEDVEGLIAQAAGKGPFGSITAAA